MAAGLVGCSSGASSDTTSTIRPAALGTGCGRAPVPGPTTSAEFGDVTQTLSVGAVQNLEEWARLDRCRTDPVVTTPAAGIITRTWRGCAAGNSVVLHTVVGGGHTWPGSPVVLPATEFDPTIEAFSATRLMLSFFRTHPAPRG
jgi:poly(3-hydroxybutyrate) depolymerase